MNEIQMEQTVALYGRDILRFCRITTGNSEAGDELYQDTMLILLEKREKLDAEQNIKSYAISVALRLWKNRKQKFLRRLQLVPQDSLEGLAEQGIQPGGESISPEELVLKRNQMALVRHLVAQLPEKYRLPVQLFYSADLNISQISKILKLPENTVKSRLHRAKEILRRKLEEQEHEGSGI